MRLRENALHVCTRGEFSRTQYGINVIIACALRPRRAVRTRTIQYARSIFMKIDIVFLTLCTRVPTTAHLSSRGPAGVFKSKSNVFNSYGALYTSCISERARACVCVFFYCFTILFGRVRTTVRVHLVADWQTCTATPQRLSLRGFRSTEPIT